ncbi:hypothetical protein ACLB2K_046074 [Fragaria x ananassa]
MNIAAETLTNLSTHQTTLDRLPVFPINNVMLKPMQEVSDLVLLVPSSRHGLSDPLVRHEQSEHGEGDESEDEEKDQDEVGIEERVEFAARAGEGEGGGRSREGAGKEGGRKDRGRRTSLMRNTYPKRPCFPLLQLGARLMCLRMRFLRLMRLEGAFFAPMRLTSKTQ